MHPIKDEKTETSAPLNNKQGTIATTNTNRLSVVSICVVYFSPYIKK